MNHKRSAYRYFALAIIFFITSLFFCKKSPGQINAKKDTSAFQPTQQEINKFVDSIKSNVTIKQFDEWLYENATGKQRDEGTYFLLWDSFIRQKFNLWVQSKSKKINSK